MRTFVKNNAKGLAVVLSAAMIMGSTAIPTTDAKAKKPKLSTTKVSITVGKTKKVTVKNAKKVTWKLDKKSKKIISLSKKSKKGATIKGKKAGSAKVSVSMKYGKKTAKKTIKVTVTAKKNTAGNKATPTPTPPAGNKATPTPTPTATPTVTPTATPDPGPTAEPTAEPEPGFTRVELDLSTAMADTGEPVPYDAATKTLTVQDLALFKIELPEALPAGSIANVKVVGSLNGELGFRSYLTPGEDVAVSNIANSDDEGLLGAFEWNFTLENEEEDAACIQFKGISHGTNIDDLTMTKVIVDYKLP